MEWGDFSYLIFSSSHARLQFSPFLSISTAFLSFHFVFPSCKRLEVSRRSRRYRQVVQNPRGTFSASLLSFHYVLPLSPLSLSALPGCLAHRTGLDLFFLSALCIWMVLCARLGPGPDVRASVCMRVYFVSQNVFTLQFVNLKRTWLRLPKSATLKFQPSRFRKSLYPVEDCISG